ncbi:MAG: flagellar M-ring protein FliF [Alphaproteobacteria bacterium]|uniref:Flagellar M-ring protein n=1 Tax=Brevundimonas mediterranea TaxID=74329 RepID=A0A6G7EJQ4_9CAUL|nr:MULTISPECIES: flagellar basal-body MS-ring/collar protein FliF [Brevundimonas]MBU1270736.1 flagellar M-ring protein FliF [Alphaproteobacteria bacterium]OGN45584.1 MAG: flagellar M-ring protein FliF [Caulobacterales bacterium RIFCSPHIGHO2_12_FULL_68_13]OGN45598.1 MAG: flagellar M-ring protein FliF [Caulobacterales bacterium RIFCSPHIGHO2_01_FULL_67_30]OYX80385.1 MAG: flagellar M-ring protein FliF [Brevundimonas sp. 32-68-21]EDX79385.1 flagellar M-ring protein FliF [Brevundimonas sp. BAL3]
MGGFTAALQKFGIGRLAAVLGVAAGVTAVLVAVMLRMGQAPDALLYSNLDLREAGEITTALQQAGIKYTSKGDGSTVMVNRDDVGTARMLIAGKGLVTSGSVGYEIFDNQSVLGQTEFQQQLNEQRALQGELSRTIMSMRGITAARVHITMPRREMFTAAAGDPTAAVLVGLGGRDLTPDQVRAIRNLVASSVPNLKPDRVTVADQNNRTLAAGSDDGTFSSASAAETKGNTEAQLQSRIKDIVEGVVGIGAARVQVTADIDQSRSTTQEQKFDPDGQVVRSTTANGSQSSDTTGQNDGGVTAANNIPGGAPPATTPAGATSAENAETTNYEISNTTTTTTKEPGEVKKLAVAVAVDGKWTPAADGKGEPTYAPRTAEEIAQIKSLVAAAAGIDEARGDKIEVINVRFNHDTGIAGGLEGKSSLLDFSRTDVMRLIELGILAVVALLLIFFVLRPLLKTAGGAAPGAVAAAPAGLPVATVTTTVIGADGQPQLVQLPAPNEMDQKIDIARIEGQVKASSVKKVADFVQAHPDEAAGILRNWVAEG